MVVFNTNKDGWETILKPYQLVAMNYLWREDIEHSSTLDVYVAVNEVMGKNAISRASIINSLNMLVDEGILSYHEITGKGGHRRIYKPVYDEEGTQRFFAQKFVRKLNEIFSTVKIQYLPDIAILPMPKKP